MFIKLTLSIIITLISFQAVAACPNLSGKFEGVDPKTKTYFQIDIEQNACADIKLTYFNRYNPLAQKFLLNPFEESNPSEQNYFDPTQIIQSSSLRVIDNKTIAQHFVGVRGLLAIRSFYVLDEKFISLLETPYDGWFAKSFDSFTATNDVERILLKRIK